MVYNFYNEQKKGKQLYIYRLTAFPISFLFLIHRAKTALQLEYNGNSIKG